MAATTLGWLVGSVSDMDTLTWWEVDRGRCMQEGEVWAGTCSNWLLSRLFSRLYMSPWSSTSVTAAFSDRSTAEEGGPVGRGTEGGADTVETVFPVDVPASLVMLVSMEESA